MNDSDGTDEEPDDIEAPSATDEAPQTASTAATTSEARDAARAAAEAADAAASAADAADAAASAAEAAETVDAAATAAAAADDAADAAAAAAADAADAAATAAEVAVAAAAAAEAASVAADAAESDAALAADDAEDAAAAADDAAAAVAAFGTQAPAGTEAVAEGHAPSGPRIPHLKALAAGVAVVVLVMMLGGLAFGMARSGDDPRSDAPRTRGTSTPTVAGTETSRPEPTTRSSPDAADLLAGCQRVVVAQDAALQAAAVTLDDWQVHVGAMNKFVVGAVTVDQLNAFWDRTGMDAITRLRDFDDAAGALRTGCPRPAQVDRDAGLRACAEAASSRRDALRSAHTAAETWAAELRDMQQLRSGAQSASQARDAWLQTWQTAVRQLEDYRRTVREVSEDAACTS